MMQQTLSKLFLPIALVAVAVTSTTTLPNSDAAAPVGQEEDQAQDCSICLSGLTQPVRALPCAHRFHQNCINNWFNFGITCPLCRQVIPAPLDGQPIERKYRLRPYISLGARLAFVAGYLAFCARAARDVVTIPPTITPELSGICTTVCPSQQFAPQTSFLEAVMYKNNEDVVACPDNGMDPDMVISAPATKSGNETVDGTMMDHAVARRRRENNPETRSIYHTLRARSRDYFVDMKLLKNTAFTTLSLLMVLTVASYLDI